MLPASRKQGSESVLSSTHVIKNAFPPWHPWRLFSHWGIVIRPREGQLHFPHFKKVVYTYRDKRIMTKAEVNVSRETLTSAFLSYSDTQYFPVFFLQSVVQFLQVPSSLSQWRKNLYSISGGIKAASLPGSVKDYNFHWDIRSHKPKVCGRLHVF